MSDRPSDIEPIVREVVRRLMAGPRGPAEASPSADELVLSERLVTLATIEGRLGGIRRLVIPPGSVVTPAVRDRLRAGRIHVDRAAAKVKMGVTRLYLHKTKSDFPTDDVARRLADLADIERLIAAPLDQAIRELQAVLAAGACRAILLCREA